MGWSRNRMRLDEKQENKVIFRPPKISRCLRAKRYLKHVIRLGCGIATIPFFGVWAIGAIVLGISIGIHHMIKRADEVMFEIQCI